MAFFCLKNECSENMKVFCTLSVALLMYFSPYQFGSFKFSLIEIEIDQTRAV